MTRLQATEIFDDTTAGSGSGDLQASKYVRHSPSLNIENSLLLLLLQKEQLSVFVESLKERRTLRQMAAVLREEVPLVYSALIGVAC